jgi:HK97 family phage portal protein
MSVIGRFLGGGQEQRTLQSSSFVPPPAVGVIDDFVGVHRAMAHMTVFACVRLLADTIASLPWKAYRRDAKGIPKEVKPQPKILQQPYPGFDLFQWKWMVVASMALRGNSYHFVTARDKGNNPTALMPMHPDIVFLERRPNILDWFDPIYRIMGEAVPSQDMIHMRRFTLPGEPWGMSPIRQASVAIGMGMAAEEYGYRFYKESATPSGVLTTDQPMDEEALERAQQNWIQSHGGRRLPAILSNGFKFEPISIRPDEAQFLETRQFQRSEICLLFGVPPILIGDTKETTAWGTGVEQITLGAVTYTFRPWTSCIESMMSNCLPGGQFVRFDYSALLRGDFDGHLSALKNGVQGTLFTANEGRAEFEMDPVEGGDNLLVPPGYLTLPAVAAARPQPATTPSTQPGKLPTPPIGGGENTPSAAAKGNGSGSRSDDPFMSYEQEIRRVSADTGKQGETITGEGG